MYHRMRRVLRARWGDVRHLCALPSLLRNPRRPLLAHLIPTRYCDKHCGYCNEYSKKNDPVPLDTLHSRIDKLAALGTHVVALSGGEPMTHPHYLDVIRHIRRRRMYAGLLTDGSF